MQSTIGLSNYRVLVLQRKVIYNPATYIHQDTQASRQMHCGGEQNDGRFEAAGILDEGEV